MERENYKRWVFLCFRTRRAMNVEEAKLERYLHEATHPRDLAWMGPISRSAEEKCDYW